MKTWIALCAACLVALSGCVSQEAPVTTASPAPSGSSAPPSVTPLSTQEVVLPSPSPAVEPSAAVPPSESPLPPEETAPAPSPTPSPEPQVPAWNGDPDLLALEDFPTQLSTPAELLMDAAGLAEDEAGLYLVAQLPQEDTWLYGTYGPGEAQGVILRVGEDWQSFDLPFLAPQGLLPAMSYGDYDGDGDRELAVVTHQDSGTGINTWGLSVVDFSGASWSLLSFAPADYAAILDLALSSTYDPEANRVVLQAGEAVLEVDLTALGVSAAGGEVEASVGGWILFATQGDDLFGSFSIDLSGPGLPSQGVQYAAVLQAEVVYTGSAFGLGGFSFSLPED